MSRKLNGRRRDEEEPDDSIDQGTEANEELLMTFDRWCNSNSHFAFPATERSTESFRSYTRSKYSGVVCVSASKRFSLALLQQLPQLSALVPDIVRAEALRPEVRFQAVLDFRRRHSRPLTADLLPRQKNAHTHTHTSTHTQT